MDKEILLIKEDGQKEKAELLIDYKYDSDDWEVIVYTRNEVDENNYKTFYISSVVRSDDKVVLLPVEPGNDWERMKDTLKGIKVEKFDPSQTNISIVPFDPSVSFIDNGAGRLKLTPDSLKNIYNNIPNIKVSVVENSEIVNENSNIVSEESNVVPEENNVEVKFEEPIFSFDNMNNETEVPEVKEEPTFTVEQPSIPKQTSEFENMSTEDIVAKLKEKVEGLNENKGKIEELKKEDESSSKKLAESENKLLEVNGAVASVQQEIDSIKEAMAKMAREQAGVVTSQYDETSKEIDTLTQRIENNKTEEEKIAGEIASQEETLSKLNEERDRLLSLKTSMEGTGINNTNNESAIQNTITPFPVNTTAQFNPVYIPDDTNIFQKAA